MRRILLLVGLLLGTAALLAGCSSASTASVKNVDAQDFVAASRAPGTVLLDVRTEAEYAAGHVQGAVNIDVQSSDFGAGIAALPNDNTYAVYCRSGRRSALAADQMVQAGLTSVINLQGGGIGELAAAGAPIVAS